MNSKQGITKTDNLSFIKEGKMKYTKQDALNRMLDARMGSLDPSRVTSEYLETLHEHIIRWKESVESEIHRRAEKILKEWEKNA